MKRKLYSFIRNGQICEFSRDEQSYIFAAGKEEDRRLTFAQFCEELNDDEFL